MSVLSGFAGVSHLHMMPTDCTNISEREGKGSYRATYRKLWFAAVVCLTPIKRVLDFFVI
jgi:hypothetical protein